MPVQVPASISSLHCLKELSLADNDLSNLPPQLGMLLPAVGGALRVLQLQGNPLRAIRRPVLDRGTAAVLDWLRERMPQQNTRLE